MNSNTGYPSVDKTHQKEDSFMQKNPIIPNMSVETAFKKLKENPNFKIPTIALTADAVSGAKEKYIKEGFVDYIAKPFNREQIKEKLDIVFSEKFSIEKNKEEDTNIDEIHVITDEDVERLNKLITEKNKN